MRSIFDFDCAMCCDTGTFFDIFEVEKGCTSCPRGKAINEPLSEKRGTMPTDYTVPDQIRQRFVRIYKALGLESRPCRLCRRMIYFVGRNPHTDDGVPHSVDCPRAGQPQEET